MPRLHIFEFHDLPWFPRVWRDVLTDAIKVFTIHMDPYRPVVPKLVEAMERCRAEAVLDLCSGSSGPWEQLKGRLEAAGVRGPVLLTDKYPHQRAFASQAAGPGIQYLDEPVDAMDVPSRLVGFRTLFASFHHFNPPEARRILQDAVAAGHGIAVLEFTERTFAWYVGSLVSPIFFWLASPGVLHPMTWRQILWIYLLPLPLLFTIWDSLVSCLRAYSPEELRALLDFPGAETHDWDIGRVPSLGACAVTYLIGTPKRT